MDGRVHSYSQARVFDRCFLRDRVGGIRPRARVCVFERTRSFARAGSCGRVCVRVNGCRWMDGLRECVCGGMDVSHHSRPQSKRPWRPGKEERSLLSPFLSFIVFSPFLSFIVFSTRNARGAITVAVEGTPIDFYYYVPRV